MNSCRIVSEVACIIFSYLCRLAISFLSRCAAGRVAWPPSEGLAEEPRLCRLNSGGNCSFLIFRKGRTKPSSIRQDAQYDRTHERDAMLVSTNGTSASKVTHKWFIRMRRGKVGCRHSLRSDLGRAIKDPAKQNSEHSAGTTSKYQVVPA